MPNTTVEERTLSILVDNSAGVLTRISGLFSRRGYNIKSLAVGETEHAGVSRMTVVVECDDRATSQIVAQLAKQECVRSVAVLESAKKISRELVLVKVSTSAENRTQVIEIANIFRARVIDVAPGSLTLELTGEADKSAAMLEMLGEFGILESTRTGAVALERGSRTIYGTQSEKA